MVVFVKQQNVSRNVRDVREIEASPAGTALQLLARSRADAFHPLLVQNPCPLGIYPQVEVLGQHIAYGFGAILRILDLIGKVV